MTFDVDKVLADACDDTGRPLRRSIDEVVRRGRRRVSRRRIGGAATGMLAIGGLVSGALLWPGGGDSFETPPVAGGSSKPVLTPRLEQPPPVATMPDREIVRRCKPLDAEFRQVSENKAGGGTDPIDNWKVVIKQAWQQRWVQAVLVSADGRRHATCILDTEGNLGTDYYRAAFEKADYNVSTGSMDGVVDRVPGDVARVTFETPDFVVTEARIKDHIILWINSRPPTTGPIWATFYDADGKQLARSNANPKPRTCDQDTGGARIYCR